MIAPTLHAHKLEFSYAGHARTIDGVDFELAPADMLALLGHNGSGKTTLAKLLAGFLQPLSGQISLDGMDVSQHSLPARAASISMVWQDPDQQIFSPSVAEELAFGPRNLGLSAADIEGRVQHAADQFGLRSLLQQRPAELSYGQRRLVSLAAVVALQRPILILDEPTLGLEPRSARLVLSRLTQMRRAGHSIVFITHDLALAMEYARTCVIMDHGRIAASGRIDELFADPSLLHKHGFSPPPLAQLAARLPGWPARLPQTSVDGWSRQFQLARDFDLI